MKKKVYINGYNFSESRSGVQRFMLNSLVAIDHILEQSNIDEAFELVVLIPKTIRPWPFKKIGFKIIKSKLKIIDESHLWQQLLLPLFVRSNFLVNFCNLAPLFKKNQLVVIHDVIPFRCSTPSRKKWEIYFRMMMRIFMHRVKVIGTVSNFSKNELQDVTGITRKIIVIGNSGGHLLGIDPNPDTLYKFGLEPGKYFLSLSSQTEARHKNFAKLLECNLN